jgi:hypothetical protein
MLAAAGTRMRLAGSSGGQVRQVTGPVDPHRRRALAMQGDSSFL